MKKVVRLRMPQENGSPATEQMGVRTTGRIKKPKAVFDPSDNYLPRSQRVGSTNTASVAAGVNTVPKKEDIVHEIYHKKPIDTISIHSITPVPDVNDVCFVCLKRENKRGTSPKHKLLSCLDCDKRVHKLCLKVDFEDAEALRQNYRCNKCRSCVLCAAFSDVDSKHQDELVTCAKCVKSYHLTCHIPNVQKFLQFQRNWKCNKCTLPTTNTNNASSALPVKTICEIIGDDRKTTTKSPQNNGNVVAAAVEVKPPPVAAAAAPIKHKPSVSLTNGAESDLENDLVAKKPKFIIEKNAPQSVGSSASSVTGSSTTLFSPTETIDMPDVKNWDVEQVTEYFAKYFPNEAHVFKDQEIDGTSLLLLKRSDVIKKLPIKLGPSVRIYSLILKLQTGSNDATLGWNCGM